MKNYFLGIFAIVLAISFSAFTTAKPKFPKALFGEKWFLFMGSHNTPGDVNNVDKYYLDNATGEEPTNCLLTDDYMCEIFIPPQIADGTKPDFNENIIATTGRPHP